MAAAFECGAGSPSILRFGDFAARTFGVRTADSPDPIERVVRAVRIRILTNAVLRDGGSVLVAAAMLIAAVAVLRALRGFPPVTPELACIFGGMVAVGASVVWLTRRVSVEDAAGEADRAAGAADRFLSALRWSARPARGPLEALAIEESRRFAERVDPRRLAPVRIPRRLGWLVLPALAVIVAAVLFLRGFARSAAERAASAQVLASAAESVRAADDSSVDAMEEELRDEAERLDHTNVPNAHEAALRSLAKAVEALREMAKAGAAPQQARGKPGEGQPGGQAGKREAGANSAEGAAESPGGEDLLGEAARRAAERTAQDGTAAGQGAQSGGGLSRQELQRLISKLEGMKQSLRSGGSRGSERNGSGGQSLTAFERRPGSGGEDPAGGGREESGEPGGAGSEHDFGTAGIRDAGGSGIGTSGPEEVAELAESDGAAVTASVISTDGPSKSNIEYRAAYDAAAPAAEDSVQREELPPGSRVLIKRYFESIRPPE